MSYAGVCVSELFPCSNAVSLALTLERFDISTSSSKVFGGLHVPLVFCPSVHSYCDEKAMRQCGCTTVLMIHFMALYDLTRFYVSSTEVVQCLVHGSK